MEGFGTIGGATVSLADSGSDFRCRLIFAISSGAKTNLPRFIIPRIFCIWTKAFNSASGIPSSTETSCKVFKARGNLVVLWPQHMVEFVQDESARMIDALRGFEPVFKNKEHQAPHLATTPRGTLNDGSQTPFDQEGNPEGT